MPAIGPRACVDLALPTSIDTARILAFQMRSGMTAQEVVARSATALGVVNESQAARYAAMLYFTQAPYAYYSAGDGSGRRKTPIKVEFKKEEGVRSDQSAHMLPGRDYTDAVAWTPEYLRDAWEAQITGDIQIITDSWRNRVAYDVLTRALSNTENNIGTGYDVPWAIGTGMSVNFIPPQGTVTFDSSHSHFNVHDATVTATSLDAALEAAVEDLIHHGHTGRLTAMVSLSDIKSYNSISAKKFVKFVPGGIQTIGGNTTSPVFIQPGELEGMPGEVFGLFLSDSGPVVILRAHESIPTGYGWMTKSYGTSNPKNGLALREHPTRGFGLVPDPQLTRSMNPELDKIEFKAWHGVGVNDRTNGVAFMVASGATVWVNPTLS
jgi:hypothetical protein